MFPPEERERLPLPSEDGGDLVNEPTTGETDDPLVAQEEGVPWVPPLDRVISEARADEGGPDVAGTADDDADELEREDDIQPFRRPPRDDELLSDVLEALRDSDVPPASSCALRRGARPSWCAVRSSRSTSSTRSWDSSVTSQVSTRWSTR